MSSDKLSKETVLRFSTLDFFGRTKYVYSELQSLSKTPDHLEIAPNKKYGNEIPQIRVLTGKGTTVLPSMLDVYRYIDKNKAE